MITSVRSLQEAEFFSDPSSSVRKEVSPGWKESSLRSLEGGPKQRSRFIGFFAFIASFFAGIWFVLSSCLCCFRKNKEVETAQVTSKFLKNVKSSFSEAITETKKKLSDPKSAEITLKVDGKKSPRQSIGSTSPTQILEPLEEIIPRIDDVGLGVEPTPVSRVEADVSIFYGKEGTQKQDLHCKASLDKGKFHSSAKEMPANLMGSLSKVEVSNEA